MQQPKGFITIDTVEDFCITLNSKTYADFDELHKWHKGHGDEVRIIKKGLSFHSVARKFVIKITFTLYAE